VKISDFKTLNYKEFWSYWSAPKPLEGVELFVPFLAVNAISG
jgi:hypothetical protein